MARVKFTTAQEPQTKTGPRRYDECFPQCKGDQPRAKDSNGYWVQFCLTCWHHFLGCINTWNARKKLDRGELAF